MCISGLPADGINLHVSFYPGRQLTARFFHVVFYPDGRLMVHCYKKFISGPPADGSQRVKARKKLITRERECFTRVGKSRAYDCGGVVCVRSKKS